MATLNHEVWANPTTPLFLQAGTSATNVAPLVLGSTPLPSTRQTIITCLPTGGGGIYYAPAGGTETQAFGELLFSNGGGWELLTNNVPQLFGYSGNIGANVPITISSPQSSTSLQLTTTSIGVPSTPASTITFTGTQVLLGQHAVAQDGTGLIVTNTNDTKASTHAPTNITFATGTTTPNTTTYNFSAESITSPPGYFTTSNVEGFVLSSDLAGVYNGGVTYTSPSTSPVGITITGTPPSSGKAIWGATTSGVNAVGSFYLEFPVINAVPGTQISIQWKNAGLYTFGALYLNDVKSIDLSPYTSTSWISTPAFTFTASGDDRFYIQINNTTFPTPGVVRYYNISDIAITQYSIGSTTDAVVGMNGSTIQMSNAVSGARVEARSSDGASALYSSTGTGSSVVSATDITLTTTASGSKVKLATNTIDLTQATNINLSNGANISYNTSPYQMTISGGSAQYFNVGGTGSLIQFTGGSLYLSGTGINLNNNVYMNSATLNMNSNNINTAGAITANTLDAAGSPGLQIGSNTSTAGVSVLNVGLINGSSVGSGGAGFAIGNCKTINFAQACGSAVLFYTGNFGAYRQLSTTMLPGVSVRMTAVFPSDFTPDNFISSDYIVVPAYSVFTLSGTTNFTQSNATSNPAIFSLSGHTFSPTDAAQRYSLTPILV